MLEQNIEPMGYLEEQDFCTILSGTEVKSEADLPTILEPGVYGVFSPFYYKWENGRIKHLVVINGEINWSEQLLLKTEAWPRLVDGNYVWDVVGYRYFEVGSKRYRFDEAQMKEIEPGRSFIIFTNVKEVPPDYSGHLDMWHNRHCAMTMEQESE